jgi:hypothetical protein
MKRLVARILMAAVLVAGAFAPALAGAVGGPRYGRYRVSADSTQTFTVGFRGGEWARLAVSGDGDTDLDVYVYDWYGNRVALDADYTDDCYAIWYVPRAGMYTIQVVNRGNVYNDYQLVMN